MIVIDANILLYAYDRESPHHRATAKWLEATLRGNDAVGLPWVTIWAFIRISTSVRLWQKPLTVQQAFSTVDDLLALPNVALINPGPRHRAILERLAIDHQSSGSRLTDAVLAALAMENGAALASTDQDFARFKDLWQINPLQP